MELHQLMQQGSNFLFHNYFVLQMLSLLCSNNLLCMRRRMCSRCLYLMNHNSLQNIGICYHHLLENNSLGSHQYNHYHSHTVLLHKDYMRIDTVSSHLFYHKSTHLHH